MGVGMAFYVYKEHRLDYPVAVRGGIVEKLKHYKQFPSSIMMNSTDAYIIDQLTSSA